MISDTWLSRRGGGAVYLRGKVRIYRKDILGSRNVPGLESGLPGSVRSSVIRTQATVAQRQNICNNASINDLNFVRSVKDG
jgi:hypothetical protein